MKIPFALLLILLVHNILANPKREKIFIEGRPLSTESFPFETSTELNTIGRKPKISRPKGWEPEVCDNIRRGLIVEELNTKDEEGEIEFYPEHNIFEEGNLNGIPSTTNHRQLMLRAFNRIAWPNSEIPFVIDDNFEPWERENILTGMKNIENKTCIRFPALNKFHSSSMKFIKTEKGCWAGRIGNSLSWNIGLGKGCMGNKVIVHEILHVAGFHHEHLRSDRDDYITLNWDNIPEKWWKHYCKIDNIDTGHPYDYVSVLHYILNRGDTPFADSHGHTLSNHKGMSEGDVAQVNYAYCRDGRPKNSCPDGFFRAENSWQCYKVFSDKYRKWKQAKRKCKKEKLYLAEPLNPVPLRSHLVDALGIERWVHIGAKGNGTTINWLNNGQPISSDSSLWFPVKPSTDSTKGCLQLMSHTPQMESNPNQPFFPGPCKWKQFTLCESCPEGFFRKTGSRQCYKLYDDVYRNWTQAKEKCEVEKLQLAEPLNPVSVRAHLVKKLGSNRWVHIGARGDGTTVNWLSSGQPISSDSSLWSPSKPATDATDGCLQLMSHKSHLESYPKQPFFPGPCGWVQHTLCEMATIHN